MCPAKCLNPMYCTLRMFRAQMLHSVINWLEIRCFLVPAFFFFILLSHAWPPHGDPFTVVSQKLGYGRRLNLPAWVWWKPDAPDAAPFKTPLQLQCDQWLCNTHCEALLASGFTIYLINITTSDCSYSRVLSHLSLTWIMRQALIWHPVRTSVHIHLRGRKLTWNKLLKTHKLPFHHFLWSDRMWQKLRWGKYLLWGFATTTVEKVAINEWITPSNNHRPLYR